MTVLTKRWGEDVPNPTQEDMASALGELDAEDDEHPDCWVTNADGWSIAAFGSGLVVFENDETGAGPWHLTAVTREHVLELWKALSDGDLDALRREKWKPGYG